MILSKMILIRLQIYFVSKDQDAKTLQDAPTTTNKKITIFVLCQNLAQAKKSFNDGENSIK